MIGMIEFKEEKPMNTCKTRTEIQDGKSVKVIEPSKKYNNQNNSDTPNSRYLADYPDVLTPTECMNILSIGRNTVYTLLQNDILKSVKIGKQYRIPKSSLENYLKLCYSDTCIDNSVSA